MEEDELISEYGLVMLELGLFSPVEAPPVFLNNRDMTHSSWKNKHREMAKNVKKIHEWLKEKVACT